MVFAAVRVLIFNVNIYKSVFLCAEKREIHLVKKKTDFAGCSCQENRSHFR